MRILIATLICLSLILSGCGGGGGGSTVTTGSGGGGGSGSGGSGSGGSTTAYNVVNATVDQGPAALNAAGYAAVNILYVKVTLCAPGSTTNCQTIDHVQVDTGSQGLRILASAITDTTLLNALQPVTVSGGSLAECTEFVDGYSWGPVVTADLHIGGSDTATSGETAAGIPVQVIGTTTYPVPTDCSSNAVNMTAENTVAAFGANGIIGLGLFDEDCGTGCAPGGVLGVENGNGYFSCTSGGCTEASVATTSQMANPVNKLSAVGGITDNNGVIIKLPAVGSTGAATVAGTLVFGISTQSNNTLAPSATVLTTDAFYGYVSTNIASLSQTDADSYLDSGSNALYFNDSSIPTCTSNTAGDGFLCPASTENFQATITGTNNQAAMVSFSIASATDLFTNQSSFAAFSNLGGPAGTTTPQELATFGWGLPFFYNRNVYTAMEHLDAGGTMGPYFAF